MSKPSKDSAYEFSDSTDWLETPLPSLAPVDSALRCQVCRDFYNTPMITECSHTFCSRCIRQCLNNDGKCPTCRKGVDATKLRNNYAIEELGEAFQRARPEIMEYAKKKAEEILRNASPKRKRMDVNDEGRSLRKRTRSGTGARQSSQQSTILDSEVDDEDYVPEDNKPGQIRCPICEDAFPTVKAVEAHVDHCNGEPPSKKPNRSTQTSLPPQPVSKPTKRPERLAQLHYGGLKDNALRKKLQDSGISATGSRQLMERRYTEWVTIWNANCDSKNPKQKGELKRELDIWERTQGGGASMPSRLNPEGNIRDKDFDRSAWSQKHDNSFEQLIVEARRKKAVKAETAEDGSKLRSSSGSVTATPAIPVPYSPPYVPTPASSIGPPSAQASTVDLTGSQVPPSTNQPPNGAPATSSQRRFYEDSNIPVPSGPPSSQYQPAQILDKDVAISSDMAPFRPVHP